MNAKDRLPNQGDLNAAAKGLRMIALDADELREMIARYKASPDFAGRVIHAAAKQMLATKKRVGLLRNPRRRPAMSIAAMLAAHARAVAPAKKKTLHKGKTAAVVRARVKAARIQTRDYIVLTGAKSGRIYARYDCEYTPMRTVKIAALALFKAKGEAITATREKF